MSNCKVISVVNQKGGVGKTTTAFNLAFALSEKGKKVLLLDFDPQSNLTMCFGIDRPDKLKTTIYHLMMLTLKGDVLPHKNDFIIAKGGIDLIPCSIELSAVEINLVNAMSRELTLKCILDQLKIKYDYIIIDCMPSLGMLTINALVACDSVLITVTPQYLSAKGLEMLLKTIIKVKKNINMKINIDGILITMFNERRNLSKEILTSINEAYGSQMKIFKNKIPASVKVGEANLNSKSIIEYKPNNKVALAYKCFAKEYLVNE